MLAMNFYVNNAIREGDLENGNLLENYSQEGADEEARLDRSVTGIIPFCH